MLLYYQMCVLTGCGTIDPSVSVQHPSFWVEGTFPCWVKQPWQQKLLNNLFISICTPPLLLY